MIFRKFFATVLVFVSALAIFAQKADYGELLQKAKQSETKSAVKVTSSWNFENGDNVSKNKDIIGFGDSLKEYPKKEINVSSDSGSGARLVFNAQNKISFKYNKSLQCSTNSEKKEFDCIKIITENECTLTVIGKGSTGKSFDPEAKQNSFSVNGKQVYKRKDASETKDQTWKVKLKKGENIISVNGMKFISFTCEP